MKRTDLALEAKEAIKGEQEIEGVALKREEKDGVTVATLEIRTDAGSKTMGKEKGTYITVELEEENEEAVIRELVQQMKQLSGGKNDKCFILGLGNREITPDALGPLTIDKVLVTRHLIREFGSEMKKKYHFSEAQALAPGVMAQTGMEMQEIVKGIVDKTAPDIVFVVDALAARSMHRLGRTIQLTDTGISPGAGVGNHRKELNRRTLGVDVIAIGVPTVISVPAIIHDLFGRRSLEKEYENMDEEFISMHVTPKNIDESMKRISYTISEGINHLLHN